MLSTLGTWSVRHACRARLTTRACASLALLLFACACASEPEARTEVLVQIEAEPLVRARARTVQLRVEGAAGQTEVDADADSDAKETSWDETLDKSHALRSERDWPLELLLRPRAGDATRRYALTATALDASGASLARVRAISGYRAGEVRLLRLRFEDACLEELSCNQTETCSGGRCEDAHVPVERLEPYSPPRLIDASAGWTLDAQARDDSAVPRGDGGEGLDARTVLTDASGSDADVTDAGADTGVLDADAPDADAPDATTVDPCATDNGGCDPRVSCTLGPSGPECGGCPTGFADVHDDGRECVSCNVAPSDCSAYPAACGPGYECGLVGHWKLDEASGTAVLDSSGHGRHGVIVGGEGDERGSGEHAGSLRLDGVNDAVDLGNISSPGPISVSAWVSVSEPPTFPIVVGKRAGNDAELVLDWHKPEQRFRFYFGLAGAWRIWTTQALPNLDESFTHVVVTYAAGAPPRFYVDGAQVSTVSHTGTGNPERPAVATSCYIGGGPFVDNSYWYWDGHIDDVRLYERVLSAAEVAALANPASR